MGNKLSSIYQPFVMKEVVVSSLSYSPSLDIGDFEGGFACQVVWHDGSSMDMKLKLECSLDKNNWSEITGSDQSITGTSGNHIWDVADINVEHVRVKIEVVSGTATFSIHFNGKQRI